VKHIKPYKIFERSGPKGKDLSIFVRFGGLDLKNQEGYGKSTTFHSPPTSRGFYAFPKVAQELFLVGSIDKFQPSTMPKGLRDHPSDDAPKEEMEKWEKERDAFDFDDHYKRKKKILSSIRKEFRKTDGYIWSHLEEEVRPSEVVDRHGSWVKTSIREWQRAFNKMSVRNRMPKGLMGLETKNINSARGITGYYSKDHCEVFFDEKV